MQPVVHYLLREFKAEHKQTQTRKAQSETIDINRENCPRSSRIDLETQTILKPALWKYLQLLPVLEERALSWNMQDVSRSTLSWGKRPISSLTNSSFEIRVLSSSLYGIHRPNPYYLQLYNNFSFIYFIKIILTAVPNPIKRGSKIWYLKKQMQIVWNLPKSTNCMSSKGHLPL